MLRCCGGAPQGVLHVSSGAPLVMRCRSASPLPTGRSCQALVIPFRCGCCSVTTGCRSWRSCWAANRRYGVAQRLAHACRGGRQALPGTPGQTGASFLLLCSCRLLSGLQDLLFAGEPGSLRALQVWIAASALASACHCFGSTHSSLPAIKTLHFPRATNAASRLFRHPVMPLGCGTGQVRVPAAQARGARVR